MAKLYFRYGTVVSAKTLNLLAVAHNYQQQEKSPVLIKPAIDTRFGAEWIMTRAGLKMAADIVARPGEKIVLPVKEAISCVLVDEAQFLDPEHIDQLHDVAHPYRDRGIPVICYGLRTNFRTELFPAAKRLFELADAIEEIKTTCHYCDNKAIFNMKLLNGEPTLDGPEIDLGCEEKYLPVCARCYKKKINAAQRLIALNELSQLDEELGLI